MATNEEIPEDLDEMSWSEIQSVVAKVKHQLDNSSDEARHQLLQRRLIEAREALAEIESRWNEDDDDSGGGDAPDPAVAASAPEEADPGPDDDIDDLLAELLVDDDEATTSLPDPEIVEAATTTARGKPRARPVDAAAAHLTDHQRATAHRHDGTDQPAASAAPTRRFTTASLALGAFVLTAVAGTAGVLLIASPEASDDDEVAGLAGPTGELEEFREVLAILDAGRLEVGWEGSVLQISGTVASAEQLEVVRDTAAVMVDYAELDISGVIVDEPLVLASESVTASPAEPDRLTPKLQLDLDRLLRTTPIMFEPGESELGELDRRILNAAVALILSAPEVGIMVVGHPDEQGTGQTGADLATTRAAAVRDYLIARGVDPEILDVRGQATVDQDGSPGAIELIVTAE